ncbi:unnamed protein product [Acanthoscelides obtectus]|uniref:Uncharacterized protein n=1 Tax=Acanthoscelides obtectus TaxID=200917 RepID=A0A9P0MG35_ACAOB|nr:unnamed protein product [Acanthoscelides obtectus]CAH2019789.1 unnamed protein product [Acanthoscelides obtectus]CAK1652807.1 hypothetical protein AOBTE_LOCUS17917 [Acanthoscelides obtectus]CAK1689572.1 hypothetical protein AOBTE_LOCUS37343 [Acanthoscelides obtectus]
MCIETSAQPLDENLPSNGKNTGYTIDTGLFSVGEVQQHFGAEARLSHAEYLEGHRVRSGFEYHLQLAWCRRIGTGTSAPEPLFSQLIARQVFTVVPRKC